MIENWIHHVKYLPDNSAITSVVYTPHEVNNGRGTSLEPQHIMISVADLVEKLKAGPPINFVTAPPRLISGLQRGARVILTHDRMHITTEGDGLGPNNLENLPRIDPRS